MLFCKVQIAVAKMGNVRMTHSEKFLLQTKAPISAGRRTFAMEKTIHENQNQ